MSLDGISSDDRFAILALDHRDSLRAFLRPDDPGSVERDEIVRLKAELISRVAQFATGVMLEPEYSIPDLVGSLPDGVGFTAALESQGYLGDPGAVPTTVLDGWSVEQAAASGASVAKLLLPFMPEHRLAEAQHQVAADVLAECRRVGIPLVLEPLFFGLADPADRPGVVIETTRRFAALGPDLLKLPFPVDVSHDTNSATWRDRCAQITELCPMPWALLSGGGPFDAFVAQVEAAVEGGCSGFLVGRALWGEAVLAPADQRSHLIESQVIPRFQHLRSVVGI